MSEPADVTDVVEALRRLGDLDASLLSDADVHQLVVQLARVGDVAAVLSAQWVSEWEQREAWRADGSRSASLALSRDTKCSLASARRVLARAHAVDRVPVTVAAVLDGRLSIDHVDVLRVEACREDDDEWSQAFDAAEPYLVSRCAEASLFDDARREVVGWGLQTLDDLDLPAPDRPVASLTRCRDRIAGTLRLEGQWSAADAEIIDTELRRCQRELLAEDRRAGVTRSRSERAAAALVRMATRSCSADGPTARPLFQAVVGDERMARLIELGSGALLHPFDLLPHLDTAVFESFLFDGRSTVVEVSSQRTFRGALRRAVQVRDRRCQHLSGCDVRASDADVDHLLPASRNGPTSQFNGGVGCRAHNRLGLGGSMPSPRPERPITWLDRRRARLRWAALRRTEQEERQLTADAYLAELDRLLAQPVGGDL